MHRKIKSVLFAVCAVLVFTAQANRPDDKSQQHPQGAKPASAARPAAARPAPASRPTPAARNIQSRPQAQTRTQAPRQDVRSAPPIQARASQPPRQQWQGPRVYAAVPAPAPVANNNRLFNRQHHNKWQPLYSFYNNQYQFYPYVDVTSSVELSADFVTISFNGQNYFYDRGRFYQQDEQGQYFAVPPPIGIVVNALPPNARQINVDGQIYYRYKGVFYVQGPQGYQVVGPVQPVSDGS